LKAPLRELPDIRGIRRVAHPPVISISIPQAAPRSFVMGEEGAWRPAKLVQKKVAISSSSCTIRRPMPRSIARRKTKKAVAKRFKITATGKLLRRKPGLRHLASSKNAKRKRNLGKATLVHETMVPRLKECMPFA
jgi:large subunit ribosomal protein L35